ncbi:MAG: hypothetical protein Q4G13_00585 [Moraxella sp.]|nr:hypothetical protein [Moraxella sp.]
MKDDVKVVSFDLFDTLVARRLKHPTCLFKILEYEYTVQYRFGLSLLGFRKIRIVSEKIARKLFSKKEDISIFDIYRVLGWFIKNPSQTLKREVDLELIFLCPIKENIDLFYSYQNDGYRCCITSDMYLPMNVIRRIIREKIGLHSVDVFLSSREGKTKYTGSLFSSIKNRYLVEYDDIMHIGDNHHSDYLIPKKLGMVAKHIPPREKTVKTDSIFELLSPVDNKDDLFFHLGYMIAGPIAWFSAVFMYNETKREGVDKIFFTARDGYLVQKIYEKLYPEYHTRYLRLSRRALYLPLLYIANDYKYLFDKDMSIHDVLFSLDVACPKDLYDKPILGNEKQIIKVLEDNHILSKSRLELEALLQYLSQEDFSGKVAFFDLGWRGSQQDNLRKITNNVQMFGYYFGLSPDAVTENKKAWYFQDNREKIRCRNVMLSVTILEFLMSEPEYSVKNIELTNGKIAFNFLDVGDSEYAIKLRKRVEHGAEAFFEDFLDIHKKINISHDVYIKSIEKIFSQILLMPSKELVDAFATITHSAGHGGGKTQLLFRHSDRFSLSEYRRSFWRGGYITNLKGVHKIIGVVIHRLLNNPLFSYLLAQRLNRKVKKSRGRQS